MLKLAHRNLIFVVMTPHLPQGFKRMDQLSQSEIPFVFFTDFEGDTAEVFTLAELEETGILVEFKGLCNTAPAVQEPLTFTLQPFPEPLEDYAKGFSRIMENLKQGNSYLANYTRKTLIETDLSLKQIFQLSKAKYKVYFPEHFTFFSPETFVEIIDNQIFTYPMKGTADASVPDAENLLQNSPKELAEHCTVVDLLRNDLSRVADWVYVKKFREMELLKTNRKSLFAVSSEIVGTVKPELQGKVGTIIKAMLPAGSILGAPKKKTLEIILQAEGYARGYYSGVCGYFDGKNLDSCVMIRFVEKDGGQLYFKSGGGLTHQSDLAAEYREMQDKIYVPIY